MKHYKDFLNILKKIGIKKDDIVYIASDVLKLLISYKKKNKILNLDYLINSIIQAVGNNGTILVPTYNWDFCKGKTYDFHKTKSQCGALSSRCLLRKDFKRTLHPIYSFAIFGKYQKHLCSLKNKSSWGKNSPFDFIYKKNAKNLFIGIDFKDAFTMDHYFEQLVKVKYRFHKNFSANYINHRNYLSKKKYSMFVRKEEMCDTTIINSKLDNILVKNKGLKKIKYNNIYLSLLNINVAGKLLLKDLRKKNSIYIYPIKYSNETR